MLTDGSHGIWLSPLAARRCWTSSQSHRFGWFGHVGDGGGVTEFTQFFDSTLFQYNMRGWLGMQNHIRTHAEFFKFFKMSTSGHGGFMMLCKNRVQLREYLGFGMRSDVKRRRTTNRKVSDMISYYLKSNT